VELPLSQSMISWGSSTPGGVSIKKNARRFSQYVSAIAVSACMAVGASMAARGMHNRLNRSTSSRAKIPLLLARSPISTPLPGALPS